MGLGLPLDLLDFDEAFVAVARGCPRRIDGPPKAVEVNGIHPAVTQIGVMRNGQQLVACLALRVHPRPQVLGMLGIQRAIGHLWQMGAVPEEDVAMQVALVRHGCPLVRTECSELARMIVLPRRS